MRPETLLYRIDL